MNEILLEQQYYVIGKSDTQYPILRPDERTSDTFYGVRYVTSSRPLIFSSANKEKNLKSGKREKITGILFSSCDFIIKKDVRDALLRFDIAGVQYHPTVYVDTDDYYHEGYWFVNVYRAVPFADLEKSTFDEFVEEEIELGVSPSAEKIVFDTAKMLAVPEEQRLIFRLGNVSNREIFVHQKIKDLLESFKLEGMRFFRVDEYEEDMMFMY